ncbi:Hypothetical protein POVN_LOCUS333 [uncultured virus]|nr:Hypothetical protein POVN_LOCUS333 [uncultured virus]
MTYHILAIPCYSGNVLSETELKTIETGVQDKWGDVSLHPTVLATLAPAEADSERLAAVAYEVLRQIILAEHTVVQHLYDHTDIPAEGKDEAKAGIKLLHVLPTTNYTLTMMERYIECAKTRPLNKNALRLLVEDVFRFGDGDKFFEGPQVEGDEPFTLYERKLNPDLQLMKPLDALLTEHFAKGMSPSTAIVVLDAQYRYCGHVYVWPSETRRGTAEVIGIRSSLLNQVCQYLPAVATKIFYGVTLWAHLHNFTRIEVMSPLAVMRSILIKQLHFTSVPSEFGEETEAYIEHANLQAETYSLFKVYAGAADYDYTEYGTPLFELTATLLDTAEYKHDLAMLATSMQLTPTELGSVFSFVVTYSPASLFAPDVQSNLAYLYKTW